MSFAESRRRGSYCMNTVSFTEQMVGGGGGAHEQMVGGGGGAHEQMVGGGGGAHE